MIRTGKQTGYILMPVIVVITLVAAIALLMNTESALESNTAASELDAQQARYVAEAGLNHALWLTQQQGCSAYGNLTDEPIGNDKYTTTLTTDLGSTSAVTISVDQDSWIRSDLPTQNNATDLKLHTRNEAAGTERSLLRYDLSLLAAKASILSATAWFYITNAHAAGPIDIHLTRADWTEADATWNSMNTNMDDVVLATIPSQPVIGIWIPVNLTSQVQAWVNGETNFGITLNSTVDGVHGQYNSRESANPPYLKVIVGTPPSSPATLKSVGALGNGVSRTISRNDVVLYQHPPGMLVLQPDAADGEDAEIWDQQPDNNYGAAAETWVSSATNDTTRSLLRFNTDALPPGAKILGATLSLERQSGSGSSQPVSAHRILNPWSETSVTWNRREFGQNWDTAGGDFENTAVATTPVGPTNQRYEWNITPLVQGWADSSYPNDGVVLVAAIPGIVGNRFYTSDHADPSRWPSLTVTYTCACGTVCVPPQGSGKIIMIGNWSGISPHPRDQEKEDVIESWGYEVDQMDDNFIWAIDFNNYDLVYISQTTSSAAVIGQISWRSIGVVNEQSDLNPDFGFATGNGTSVGDSIDITDNSHYISAPFALGSLPIYSAQMELVSTGGTLAGGGQTLAEASGAESLMLLDAGASSVNGPAPGKRVVLPLGRATNSNFDWTYLNNNGRLLVQRSIEWASGGVKLPPAGSLLMVVGNPASLTVQESTKKALIESWGYTVSLIDDGDSQVNFDTAAANDVIYVSGSISGGDLANKLTGSPTPIVNEFAGKLDNFGFSSGTTQTFTADTFLTSDTRHYISSPFGGGTINVLTTFLAMPIPSGTLAPDLQIPAGFSAFDRGLVTLDTGALRWDGTPAPARRVHLPFGATQASQLTDDGKTIMRRAIEWAGGANFVLKPVAHWKLDETTGIAAVDSEGGHDGTLTNGPAWSGGQLGGGLQFDGNNDSINVVHDDSLSLNKFTISAWISTDTVTGFHSIVYKGATTAEANYHFYTHNDEIRLGLTNGGWQYFVASTTANLTSGRWYHLATTVDGSSGEVKLYLDGNLIETANIGVSILTNTGPITIGSDPFNEYWDGRLDDVRIYNKVLSDAEVAELAALPGPIAHWKLDETSGTTAVDSVGGYDGTLINWPASPDWVAGKLDGGLSFDGSNDYIDVSSMNPRSYDDFTVSAWYKSADTSVSDDEYIFEHNDNFTNEVTFGPTDDGAGDRLRFGFAHGGSATWDPHYGTSDIVDQQWHLVVGVRSGGRIKLYVDGVLETDEPDAHAGSTVVIDGDGPFIGDLPGNTEQVHGILDDVRLFDRALSDTEIAELFSAGGGSGGVGYTEMYQNWSASSANTWQTVNLSVYGVPANAVVEVALENHSSNREREAGVRAVGSSVGRTFDLHEAESGGMDAIVLHVQSDASSQIQHFAENTGNITFRLLGYWTGATYVELFDQFEAGNTNSWDQESLAGPGVGPNQVAEIVVANTSSSNERLGGVRAIGSSASRRFSIHKAESGGIDAVTLQVNTNGASNIEVFASSGDIDFYLVGYWSTAPGTYTETGGAHGQVTAAAAWETVNLTSFGVPANSVAQFVLSNERDGDENQMGVRETGSAINNRRLDLHKAEAGGSDLGSMHVNVDASSQVQWAAEYGATEGLFYPVGWWVLSP